MPTSARYSASSSNPPFPFAGSRRSSPYPPFPDVAAAPRRRLALMRWVDHWIGLPMCFVLGLFATIARKLGWRRSRQITGRRPLAVFKFFGMGSIAGIVPLLHALRRRYPNAPLVFFTFQNNEQLVRLLDAHTHLRIIRTDTPVHFICDVLREIVWMRRKKVEAVVDLEIFSKFSTLLSFAGGARVRSSFHLNDFWRYSLVTHPIYFNYYHHISDVYAQAAACMGATMEDRRLPRIQTSKQAKQAVSRFLQQHGWNYEHPVLGINVNAGELCPERRWPAERFIETIEQLHHHHPDLLFVLTGSRSEQPYVQSIINHLPPDAQKKSILAASQWSLEETIAALNHFTLFLTNDSGPMHLAAAQQIPMISLWGPGRPSFYAPRTEHHHVLYHDYPCSPCLYMFTTFEGMWCNHQAWCMQQIDVNEVVDTVNKMLDIFNTAGSTNA